MNVGRSEGDSCVRSVQEKRTKTSSVNKPQQLNSGCVPMPDRRKDLPTAPQDLSILIGMLEHSLPCDFVEIQLDSTGFSWL